MKKLGLIFLYVSVGVVLFASGWGLHIMVSQYNWRPPNPFKVIDPHDPRFNPENFRINDYRDAKDLREAFSVVFKPGMPKDDIDRIMAKSKCYPNKIQGHSWWIRYLCPPKFHPILLVILSGTRNSSHDFIFDRSNNLLNIHINRGDKIFEKLPGKKEVELEENKDGNR